jgi:hypothetical protein
MIEKLHFLLALVAASPVALLIGLALVTPITLSGALYLLGLALLAAGARAVSAAISSGCGR